MTSTTSGPWHPTACILCECNCGIEVQLGGDEGRRLTRFRGDKAHPASRGYTCEKPQRLDYYQNNPERLLSPLRRREDGSFEEIDWETAIREVAARLTKVRDAHGGASIFYYGGGGQGNHLPGAYAVGTRRALGARYRSSALAQEKTGEFWVSERPPAPKLPMLTIPSCSRRASGAPIPPTPSYAIPPGAHAMPMARCASAPPTPPRSSSPVATP